MRFYEMYIADSRYHSNAPLTYSSEEPLRIMSVVTVQLRQRTVTGFVVAEVEKPSFNTKPIRALVSKKPLPAHSLELSKWLSGYYATNLSEALRQFAPSKPTLRLEFKAPLTKDQAQALKTIRENPSTTTLLHGHTGTGKTRVYVELAKKTIENGKSVILLTPEIALTSQLTLAVSKQIDSQVFVLHSQLTQSKRKQIWLSILESDRPCELRANWDF
jgi:primosomal protein N' (replication factor Y)